MRPRESSRGATWHGAARFLVTALLVTDVTLVPRSARADVLADAGILSAGPAASGRVEDAHSRFGHGLTLYGNGDYAGARQEFEKAYTLAPSYKLFYNIARCHTAEGNAAAGLRYYERYLRGGEVAADRRAEVEREIGGLRARVAPIIVRTNVPDAQIEVDDEGTVGVSAELVPLNPGRRKLWATKPGYYPASTAVDLAVGGSPREVALELRPLPAKVSSQPPRSRFTRTKLLYGALAGGGLAVVVLLVLVRRSKVARPMGGVPRVNVFEAPTEEPISVEPSGTNVNEIVLELEPGPLLVAGGTVVVAGAVTDIGRAKPSNQDAFLVSIPHRTFVVADGIGGYEGGELASATAIEVLGRSVTDGTDRRGHSLSHLPPIAGELATAVFAANKAIREKARANREVADMGTTCVAARFAADFERLYIAHLGDSRAYLLRNRHLIQLTTDHTMEQLGLSGVRGALLSRALGTEPCPTIDMLLLEPRLGDIYLLCSDGLTKMVDDRGIGDVLRDAPSPESAAQALVDLANAQGGKDNVTALVVRLSAA